MRHEAKHPLPISTGYNARSSSSGYDYIRVQCGRCNDNFDIDADWIDRWAAFELREVERQRGKGYHSVGQLLDWEQNIARTVKGMRAYVKGPLKQRQRLGM
jgi:hypothetical protein